MSVFRQTLEGSIREKGELLHYLLKLELLQYLWIYKKLMNIRYIIV